MEKSHVFFGMFFGIFLLLASAAYAQTVDLGAPYKTYLGGTFNTISFASSNLNILAPGMFEGDDGTVYNTVQTIKLSQQPRLSYNTHGVSDTDAFYAFDLSTTVTPVTNLYSTTIQFSPSVNSMNMAGQEFTMFGRQYTFSAESTPTKVILYEFAKTISLTPQDTTTIELDGKQYTVELLGFDNTALKALIKVNGETSTIQEGQSKTIGGLKVYGKSIATWNNGADGMATLLLGANKISFENGFPVQLGSAEESVDGTYVQLGGTPSSLNSISVFVNAPNSDADYIGGDHSIFRDPVYRTFRIAYVNNSIDQLNSAGVDKLVITPSGSRTYVVVPKADGSGSSLFFNYNGALKWDADKKLYPYEGASAEKNSYVYLAPSDPKYTHIVKIANIVAQSTAGYVEFSDALTGASYKTSAGRFSIVGDSVTLNVEGKSYRVVLTGATPGLQTVSVWFDDGLLVIYPLMTLRDGESFAIQGTIDNVPAPAGTKVLSPIGQDVIGSAANTIAKGMIKYSYTTPVAPSTAYGSGYGSAYGYTPSPTISMSVVGHPSPSIILKEGADAAQMVHFVLVPTQADGNTVTPSFTGTNSGFQASSNDDVATAVDYFGSLVQTAWAVDSAKTTVSIFYPNEQVYANAFMVADDVNIPAKYDIKLWLNKYTFNVGETVSAYGQLTPQPTSGMILYSISPSGGEHSYPMAYDQDTGIYEYSTTPIDSAAEGGQWTFYATSGDAKSNIVSFMVQNTNQNVTPNVTYNVTHNWSTNITPNVSYNFTPNWTQNVTRNVSRNSTQNITKNVSAVPVCLYGGTEQEGWYVDSRLVKLEKCLCTAVCRSKPATAGAGNENSRSIEGYYSSCTGKLIVAASCSAKSKIVMIGGKPIPVTPKARTNGKAGQAIAAGAVDAALADKELTYPAQDALEKAVATADADSASKVEIAVENDEAIYHVTVDKKAKFLGFIPYTTHEAVGISAETGNVLYRER